jgi:predicted transcriptional regulator
MPEEYRLAMVNRKLSTLDPRYGGIRKELRGRFEISFSLLQTCMEPTRGTHLMNAANISWGMLRYYTTHLMTRGLMETSIHNDPMGRPGQFYHTTEKGKEYINLFTMLQQYL